MKKGRCNYTWDAHPLRDTTIGKRKPTPPKRRRAAKARSALTRARESMGGEK